MSEDQHDPSTIDTIGIPATAENVDDALPSI